MTKADTVPDRHFWNGKQILLTGHTGFKGAWMTMLLRSPGARVAGVSLEAEKPSLFEQAGLARRTEAHQVAGLRDMKQIQAIADADPPEIVLPTAAPALA